MVDIAEVKNYLNRTYDDPESDKKLQGIMKRAESKVRKLIGAVNGEELDPDEEQLFLDCCRYLDNNAAEEFDVNFRETINSLRYARSVAGMDSEEAEEMIS